MKYTATKAKTMASTQPITATNDLFFDFFHHVQGMYLVMNESIMTGSKSNHQKLPTHATKRM
jgi:hypothetical protein